MAKIPQIATESGNTLSNAGAYEAVEGVEAGTQLKLYSANGGSCALKVATASTTLSGATTTETGLIPAGANVVAVVGRVTTAAAGAVTIDAGDGSDADIYAADFLIAVDTTFDLTDSTSTGGVGVYAAAGDIVFTAVGGAASFSAGVVRTEVYYYDTTAPQQ